MMMMMNPCWQLFQRHCHSRRFLPHHLLLLRQIQQHSMILLLLLLLLSLSTVTMAWISPSLSLSSFVLHNQRHVLIPKQVQQQQYHHHSQKSIFTIAGTTPKHQHPQQQQHQQQQTQQIQQRPHMVFPGGGLYFYWQAGVVTYLREQGYQLVVDEEEVEDGGDGDGGGVTLAGASAGALTATLTATKVDFEHAMELALSLSQQAGVWDRPQGLQGIWGTMIETWLQELLPSNAIRLANSCQLQLAVTHVPSFQKEYLDNFENRIVNPI